MSPTKSFRRRDEFRRVVGVEHTYFVGGFDEVLEGSNALTRRLPSCGVNIPEICCKNPSLPTQL